MILVDTSVWIEALRERGNPEVRRRLQELMEGGLACWTPVVRLELWNGARGDREKRALAEFEQVIPELEITDEVWTLAYELARRSRASGLTVPTADLIIAACARHHAVEIDSLDAHFAELRRM
jgi:predicted nucleic acid-binding protein